MEVHHYAEIAGVEGHCIRVNQMSRAPHTGVLTDDRDDPRGHDSVCIKKLAYSNVIGCCRAKLSLVIAV